jgi:PAS domain S-box-containing protein
MDPHGATGGGVFVNPFDVAGAATAVVDSLGVLVRWSAGAERLVGYEVSEVVGRRASDLLLEPGSAGAAVSDALRRTREGLHGLVSVRRKDGAHVDLAVRAYPSVGLEEGPYWLIVAAEAARMRRVDQDWAVLEGLFTQSSIGLLVSDTDLRCVRRNVALERMTGVPAEERLGKRIGEALPDLGAPEIEVAMRRVLATGTPVADLVHSGRTPADPEHEHVWSTGIFRIQDPAGKVIGLCHTVVDVTERHRSQGRLALLNDASTRIGTTLDVTRTAQELAEVAVPILADTVTVHLLDSVHYGEAPMPGPVGEGITLRRSAYHTSETGRRIEGYQIGDLSRYPASAPQAQCMADLRPRLVPRLTDSAAWLEDDPGRAALLRAAGVHSLVAVPLTARGVLMGVTSFYRWRNPTPHDDDDLALAAELASRAALCIDNARRYTREHATSLALQRSLLPRGLPSLGAVEVAGRYQPAGADSHMGGDWFDVIPLSGARVALVVGDVPGHGLHASATMGRLRTAVRTLADLDLPPDEVLTHLDDMVALLVQDETADTEIGSPAGSAIGTTCLYAVYDPVECRCTLARAGHFPPAVVRTDGTVDFPDLPAGPPLGLGGLPFENVELSLAPGSLLVLFTNGLVQARDPDIDVGLESLRRILSGPDRSPQDVCDQVTQTLVPTHPPDDVALLIARTRALGPDRVATWDLRADPAVVAEVRTQAARQLTEWGLHESVLTTELVVSELVTNAIRYGRAPIRLRLIRSQHLICEVSDASSTSPHLRRAQADDEGGRGLFLVAQLTQRWGTRYTASGKTIWTQQDLPQPG